jgi:hypothetical protein
MDKGFGFAILFTLATQMTGLGLAGMFRKYLVYPASMIWPGILPNAALFHTLHDGVVQLDPAATSGWKIPRFRFFLCKSHYKHIVDQSVNFYRCSPRRIYLVLVSWIPMDRSKQFRLGNLAQAKKYSRKSTFRGVFWLQFWRPIYCFHSRLDLS